MPPVNTRCATAAMVSNSSPIALLYKQYACTCTTYCHNYCHNYLSNALRGQGFVLTLTILNQPISNTRSCWIVPGWAQHQQHGVLGFAWMRKVPSKLQKGVRVNWIRLSKPFCTFIINITNSLWATSNTTGKKAHFPPISQSRGHPEPHFESQSTLTSNLRPSLNKAPKRRKKTHSCNIVEACGRVVGFCDSWRSQGSNWIIQQLGFFLWPWAGHFLWNLIAFKYCPHVVRICQWQCQQLELIYKRGGCGS